MKASEALEIIIPLANGIDPFTGEILPDNTLYQNPHLIRALFKAIIVLESEKRKELRKRNLPENAGKPWLEDEEKKLIAEFENGKSIADIALLHKRTKGSIESRLVKLGKLEQSTIDKHWGK